MPLSTEKIYRLLKVIKGEEVEIDNDTVMKTLRTACREANVTDLKMLNILRTPEEDYVSPWGSGADGANEMQRSLGVSTYNRQI